MSTNELVAQAQYIVNTNGQRTAVVLDIESWEQLMRELGFDMQEESINLKIDPSRKIRLPGIRLAAHSRRPNVEVTEKSAE